jgi:hypothetical protein
VVGTVETGDLDVDHGEAGQHAGAGFLSALADGGDVFLRNHAALDLIDDIQSRNQAPAARYATSSRRTDRDRRTGERTCPEPRPLVMVSR